MEAEKAYVSWIAELFPPQGQWTEADYFALPETNRIIELANGELSMPPAPGIGHQNAARALFRALDRFVQANGLGEVYFAPVDVRLFPGTIRQPDVLFLREEHRERITERYIDGPPDWVAEVISEGTRHVDEEVKTTEYASAGVPEYWLVDPEDKTIRVHVLEGNAYRLAAIYRPGQVARAETLPGFEIAVNRVVGE